MLKQLRNYFLTGLFIILPLTVSLALLWWAFVKIDWILGNLFQKYLKIEIPGLGLITLLVLITFIGLVAQNYLGKKLIHFGEMLVTKIPILRGIYNTTKQFTEGLTQADKSAFRQVVLIEYPRPGIFSPGFLTGDSPPEACRKTGKKLINVFVPMVPNPMGGFLVFVPENEIIFLDMSIEDGLKLFITAGVIKPESKKT
jgi:uncharacterized membrane protein